MSREKAKRSTKLTGIEELVRKVRERRFAPFSGDEQRAVAYDPALGALRLTRSEIETYDRELTKLITEFANTEIISVRTVERWFQEALLQALQPVEDDPEFETQLSQSISELRERLHETPCSYDVYLPVNGLDVNGLPCEIAGIRFEVFNEGQLEKFRELAQTSARNEDDKDFRVTTVGKMWERDIGNQVFAKVQVLAVDDEAARIRAQRQLRTVIDSINFCTNFVQSNHGLALLPGENGGATVVSPLVRRGERESFGVEYSKLAPYGLLDLRRLHEAESHRLIEPISELMTGVRTQLQEIVLASIIWAGRATAEQRREEAFLLHVIALEAIVLADQDPVELGYRLRIRLAHLLGNTVEERFSIVRTMNKLYGTRSGIVHSGKFEVTDADLSKIRFLAVNALRKMLLDPDLSSLKTKDHLRDWFDKRILDAGPSPD
jgi:hypothetical protein